MKTVSLLVALVLIFIMLGAVWPIGPDYALFERPAVESFIHGETRLYDSASVGFYNAPWTILLLLPTVLLPIRYGQALLSAISLVGILVSIVAVLKKSGDKFNLLIILLALLNLHTFDLLIRGNLDGILALGVGLSWIGVSRKNPLMLGAGLWLLSTKPINILFVIPLLVKAVWDWSARDKIIVILPLATTAVASFFVVGFDWPIRYINAMIANPPLIYLQTSLWRAFELFGLQREIATFLFLVAGAMCCIAIVASRKIDGLTLTLVLSANLVFSPYTLGSHYVLLAPALVILAQKYKPLLAIWMLTLTPLLRLFWGFGVSWIDIIYPLSMMCCVIYIYAQHLFPSRGENENQTRYHRFATVSEYLR